MLSKILSISNELSVSQSQEIAVKKGASKSQQMSFFPSAFSVQCYQQTIIPNNLTSLLESNILHKVSFDVAILGVGSTVTGNIIDIGVYSAVRSFALERCINNTNLTQNGTSSGTYQNSDVIDEMERYMDSKEFLETNCSSLATKPDIFQSYNTPYNGTNSQRGIVRGDPLTGYGNSEGTLGRGSYDVEYISGNNSPGAGIAGSVGIRITFHSSVLHPALKAYKNNGRVKVGIRSLIININFNNNLFPLMFSQSNSANAGIITSSTVTITEKPRFSVTTYEVPETFTLPLFLYEPYPKQEITTSEVGIVNAGASKTVYINSYQLGTELNYISIWVKRSKNSWNNNCTNTNTFGKIKRISVSYDGTSNILSDATEEQLFLMANKNGLLLNFIEATKTGYCGAPIRLYFPNNIPISGNSAPGMACNKNISLSFEFENISNENIDFTAYVCYCYSNVMETVVNEAKTTIYQNIVSEQDLYMVGNTVTDQTNVTPNNPHNMWGGGKKPVESDPHFVPYEQMLAPIKGKKGLFGGMAVNKNDLRTRY
jgi:hypothetical protein